MAYLLFSFEGRIRRTSFWVSIIITTILYMILTIPAGNLIHADGTFSKSPILWGYWAVLAVLFSWMGFAISAKRLHDIGKSGWWQLICLIPLVGLLYIFYYGLKQTQEGVNKYGNPQPR